MPYRNVYPATAFGVKRMPLYVAITEGESDLTTISGISR